MQPSSAANAPHGGRELLAGFYQVASCVLWQVGNATLHGTHGWIFLHLWSQHGSLREIP